LRRVYWDTMVFAYWLEGNPQFARRVRAILNSMVLRQDILCTSLFTLAELLVHPVRDGDELAQNKLETFFRSTDVSLLEFLPTAPPIFAMLRASYNLKAMDAFHLSIAAASGVDVFLTNDRRLHSIKRSGLPLIASLDTDIF
jgi:predicted nucleic acid-binding protein